MTQLAFYMCTFFLSATAFCFLGGCSSTDDDESKVVSEAQKQVNIRNTASGSPISQVHCFKWPFERLPPLYIKTEGIMVTRMMKSCVTIDGENGFAKGASWMAMGFPCTGGPGKVEWKGSFYRPKMLSFIIANSCPMQPKEASTLASVGVTSLKLTPDSSLLAYYPLAIQYWELLDYDEADTGYIIEVRRPSSVPRAWKDFRRDIPIRLRLFGRENAWVRGRNIYQAEVELTRAGRSSFKLKVINAKPLTEQDRVAALSRCEALRPERNCTEVFSL